MLSYSLNIVLGIMLISQHQYLFKHWKYKDGDRLWPFLSVHLTHYMSCCKMSFEFWPVSLHLWLIWRIISPQRPGARKHIHFLPGQHLEQQSAPVLLSDATIPVRRQRIETHKTQECSSFTSTVHRQIWKWEHWSSWPIQVWHWLTGTSSTWIC